MAHRDAVAICQTDFIASGDFLTIDSSEVLVLIVAQHGLLCAIWQCLDCDATMLATHISVTCLYLYGGFRGSAFSANNILSFFKGIANPTKQQLSTCMSVGCWRKQLCCSKKTCHKLGLSIITIWFGHF